MLRIWSCKHALTTYNKLGSCWAIGTMYSGVSGSVSPGETAEHLIERINTSYLDMDTLDMLITPPTNKVRFPTTSSCNCVLKST